MYARVAHYIGDRKTLSDDRLEGLEEILMDSTKAQAIAEAGRMSMGESQEFYLASEMLHFLIIELFLCDVGGTLCG